MRRAIGWCAAIAIALLAASAYVERRSETAGGNAGDTERGHDREGSAALMRTADVSHGAQVFAQCAACHAIGRTSEDRDGPNLYGVVGSPVAGRRPRFAYTAALRRLGGLWSVDRLDAWLTDPAAMVPGTSMAFRGLPDGRDRADVIAYLGSRGPQRPGSERP